MKSKMGKFFLLLMCVIVTFTAIPNSFSGPRISASDERPGDYFIFPEEIIRSGFAGTNIPVAKIMPAFEYARNYLFNVWLGSVQIPTDGYSFKPERAGEYVIRYFFQTDDAEYNYSYRVNITYKEGLIFDSTPSFPNAFIAGKTYCLPEVDAFDWSGGIKQKATVTAAVKCGTKDVSINNNSFTPIMDTSFTQTEIVYTAVLGNKTETLKISVPVLNVYNGDAVDMKNLFYSEGFDLVQSKEDCISFVSYGDSEVKYANALGSEGMTIEFGFGATLNQAESLVLLIESYDDPSVAVSLEFNKGMKPSGTGLLILNNSTKKNYTYSTGQHFVVKIDEGRSRLVGEGNVLLFDIKEDLNGQVFKGFKGGRIKISLSVKNSYGNSELCIYKINSQLLTSMDEDLVLPSLALPIFKKEYFVGDIISIDSVYAIDVIDANATVLADVVMGIIPLYDINNNKLEQVNASIPMSFEAKKSGVIRITYTVADSSGNSYPYNSIIYVYDTVKPEITVNKDVPGTAKLNASITLPGATATDNDGLTGLQMQIIVITPTSKTKQIALSNGKGSIDEVNYTFDKEGNYIVRYVATDLYNNYIFKEFNVKVGG